jgi:ring-1,2-phenylacetyl-CoA epoxidase subunit PaaE
MIDEVQSALCGGGLDPHHVHVERFGVPVTAPAHHVEAQDAARAQITVHADGTIRTLEFRADDPSILDAALRSGLDLPYSCKGGMCCTCRAKVLAGRVRMDKNYSLEARDLEAGFVLTCQAHPLTDHVTISYDER